MADNQPTETVADEQQVPVTSVVSYIPDDLRNDPWVLSIATRCDELRADRDRERAEHKVTREGLYDALSRGLVQAGELATARETIRRADVLRDLTPRVLLAALIATFIICITVATVMGH